MRFTGFLFVNLILTIALGTGGCATEKKGTGGNDSANEPELSVGDSVDLDGDGQPDGTAVDSDGDGFVDGVDTDGDGYPDVTSHGEGLIDEQAPVFSGLDSVTALSTTELQLSWIAAQDRVTPPENLVYLIYLSPTADGFDFGSPVQTTQAGITEVTITGLNSDTEYFFTVRARDTAGNTDENTTTKSAVTNPDVPSTPTGLTATGSHGQIDLSWSASTGDTLTGYAVYRSTDGENFTEIDTVSAPATSYTDSMTSPDDDGIYYYYQVTALGDEESPASTMDGAMHGTHLGSSYTSTTILSNIGSSPYVLDGASSVTGGRLEIPDGSAMYITPGSTLTLNNDFRVKGLLRARGTVDNPITINAPTGESFWLNFYDSSVDYDPGDGSGSIIEYVQMDSLSNSSNQFDLVFTSASPLFRQNKVTGVSNDYLYITANSAPIVENNNFTNMTFYMTTYSVVLPASFSVKKNTFSNSYYPAYFRSFSDNSLLPFAAGQIEQNQFNCDTNDYVYFGLMDGSGDLPLGNNFWSGCPGSPPTPTVSGATTISVDFSDPSAALSASPADAGPDW